MKHDSENDYAIRELPSFCLESEHMPKFLIVPVPLDKKRRIMIVPEFIRTLVRRAQA